MFRWSAAAVIGVALLVGHLRGQQTPPSPVADPEAYARFLEGAERVSRLQVPRVIDALGLTPGMRVADLGSGSGLFTRPMAIAVRPGGVAYAVDINEGLLRVVARSAREHGLDNLRTVHADPDDPKLPEPVDVVLICDTLHHIVNQGAYLKTVRRYLKPGGRVAVIDFSEHWPEGHEPMAYTEARLGTWMAGAGFSRLRDFDFLDNSFFVIFGRPLR
jgi:ubiquinone/menaquinone biosynthesis C-methylase UbiE